MPKVNDLGYGPFTYDKIKAFRSILKMHMAIARSVWYKLRRKNNKEPLPYLYLDLTAGPGYANPEHPEEMPGSPIIFLVLATSPLPKGRSTKSVSPIPFEAHFFEKDPSFAEQLRERVNKYRQQPWCENLSVHAVDYTDSQQGLPALLKNWGVQHYRFGLIYVDHSGDLPDFDVLARAVKNFPQMEILLHISATVIKRRSRAHNIPERLMDLVGKIPKREWLIRDTKPGDKFQWTFLMGTDARDSQGKSLFRGLKKERFYQLSTEEGQSVLKRLTYTQDELARIEDPPLIRLLNSL